MADREAESGPLSSRFGREEGVEHLFLHIGRNAGAVVANTDLYPVTEVSSRSCDGGLIAAATDIVRVAFFCLAPDVLSSAGDAICVRGSFLL